jgi:type III secretion protein D
MKGRTIALHPGDNVIGSGTDCDVMLPSGDVAARHLVITVGDLVVTLRRVDAAPATLNGVDMQERRRTVVVGDVVAIGQAAFQFERLYPASDQDESPFDWAESMFATNEPTNAPSPRPEPPRVRWVGAALLLLVALGMVALASVSSRSVSSMKGDEVSAEAVKHKISVFPEVEVVASADGKLTVRGFVESGARKQALREAVKPFGPGVVVSIQAADEIVEQASQYLGNPAIAVEYTGKGLLVVSGVSDDEKIRQKIRQLTEDFHPAVLVVDRVQFRAKQGANGADVRAQWAIWQGQFPARLVSITEDGNGVRYVQLSNGNRYYEGAILRSGTQVTRIDATSGLEFDRTEASK